MVGSTQPSVTSRHRASSLPYSDSRRHGVRDAAVARRSGAANLQHDLHTSPTGVAWVFTAYLLAASVATPIAGRLGDMFGKKRMLVLVLAGLALGSLVAALATTLPVMIAARTIEGLGGAIFPLTFGIVRDQFPRDRVAGGIALVSGLLGIGGGLGIILQVRFCRISAITGCSGSRLPCSWSRWLPRSCSCPSPPSVRRGTSTGSARSAALHLADLRARRHQRGAHAGAGGDAGQHHRAARPGGRARDRVGSAEIGLEASARPMRMMRPPWRVDDESRRVPARLRAAAPSS